MKKPSNKTKHKPRNRKSTENVDKYVVIKKALENPRYRFRTIDGVIREAHVSAQDITEVMTEHAGEFVVLYRRGENGQKLITTREHYKKKASIQEKIMGAVLNRVY